LLLRWPGTHSRILSGIQRAAQTVLGIYLKRTMRYTSASGVLNDYAPYTNPRIHSIIHSLTHSWGGLRVTLPCTDLTKRFKPLGSSLKHVCSASSVGCQRDTTRIRAAAPALSSNGAAARRGRRYRLTAGRAPSSKSAARHSDCRTTGQTDERTDTRPLYRPCSAYDTIRDAMLTCARKPTRVGLIYRT